MLGANRRAKELLGPRLADVAAGARCCDVLGCPSAGELDGGCLTRAARRGAMPAAEIALPMGRGPGAAVLYASVACTDASTIVTLRPSAQEPAPAPRAALRLVTLGRTRIERPEGVDEGEWLGQRPGTLLKLLVARRPRILHAEEIADTLWPNSGPSAMGNVRHFVHALREHLDPGREKHSRASYLSTRSGGYVLDFSLLVIDADEFEAHVASGLAAARAGDVDEAIDRLQQGLALYGGDFLEDEPYADWALAERERLRSLACRALETVGAMHLAQRNFDDAQTALLRLTELEPFDIQAHRALIVLELRMGRRGHAVRRFHALRRRVSRTFGEPLDFTLSDLSSPPHDAPRLSAF